MAEDETSTKSDGDDAERLSKKDRAIRRRVLLTVTPLVLSLLIPWEPGAFWTMNERVDTRAFLAIPLVAIVATVIALLNKRSLLVRSLLLGALGATLASLFEGFFTEARVLRELPSEIRRLDAYALYVCLGAPLFALTMELFAALDRRSRLRALGAGFGWATLALLFFVPMRSDQIESMPFLLMTEAVDDARRNPEHLLAVAPMAFFLFFAMGNATLTILRLIGDAGQRERWRPRSGCMAIGLGMLPALLLGLAATFQTYSQGIEWLGTAINGSLWTLGFWVGLPVLLAAGLDGVASTMRLALGRGEPVLVKRARLALGAVGGLAILSCLTPVALNLLPDDHDDAADVLIDVADNVVESAMGGEVDPRFVGGYSEYDLRGSVGVLQQEAPGTDASLRYATFEMRITNGAVATIVVGVDPDGGLVFLGGGPTVDVYPNRGSLRLASEPLADLAEDIATGLSSLTCLPGSAPPDLPGLVDTRSTLAPLCSGGSGSADDSRRRIDELAGSNHADGDTGTYRVWVQTGDVVHVLTGRLYSDLGRLWIGRATVESNP